MNLRPPGHSTLTLSAHAVSLTLCLLALILFAPHARADLSVSTETREGRLAVFDDVWRTIGERYYDPSMRGLDWAAQRERFRPLAADARTRKEFYTTLRRMIAELRDPHTRVFTPDERSTWDRPVYTSVGLSLREIDSQLIVTQVERDSEAEAAGVRAGDALVKVDGEAARDVLARRAAEGVIASAGAAARLSAIARLFEGERDSFITLGFASDRERGGELTVRLRRERRTRSPQFNVSRTGGIGVVRFNIFTQETANAFVRALTERKELREGRGLVVDLRDNGGGEAEAMIDIASAFLPAGTPLGAFTDRAGRTVSAPQARRAMLYAAEEITSFGGPVVVLAGARTASASEIFAAALRDAGRARVLGERTCGCVLAIRTRHPLADGGVLDVSEMDYRTARAARLEGSGIAPDETITPTRRDIEEGRDPALARAVAFLKASR